MFRIVRLHYGFELWRDSKFLSFFMKTEDMLEFVYNLDRYELPEELQLPLEWD